MTELVIRIAAVVVASYLIGGVPWALIIGKRFYGIDPREHGSGNLGATNVFRVLGARAGGTTLALDALKGALAVLVSSFVVTDTFGIAARDWTAVGAMMVAVLGHAYSPYIGFKGGKGVATSAGGLLVLTPLAVAIELLLFVAVTATTRMVSLGSVVIAIAYPVLVFVLYPRSPSLMTVSVVLAALVLWRHRTNIVRIARGEESRVSLSRRGEALRRDERDEG